MTSEKSHTTSKLSSVGVCESRLEHTLSSPFVIVKLELFYLEKRSSHHASAIYLTCGTNDGGELRLKVHPRYHYLVVNRGVLFTVLQRMRTSQFDQQNNH